MAEDALFDFTLKSPAGWCIFGCSQAGKTTTVLDIIRNRNTYFRNPISKVIYCYYRLNDALVQLAESDPDVILVEDIHSADKLIQDSCLLVLEDLQGQLGNRNINDIITNFFIRKIHHFNFTLIFTLQRACSETTKTIRDNTQYRIYFDR